MLGRQFWLRVVPTRPRQLAIAVILVPTAVAAVYFALIASDIYVSESRFAVRSSQPAPSLGAAATILRGTGFAHSDEDAFYVRDYILSRDAIAELDSALAIRQTYSSKDIDLFDRFPVLSWDRSFEEFFRYITRRISVDIDSSSSISILRVEAFSPEQAEKINRQLLAQSEQLVNRMNERSRADAIRFAQVDVTEAQAQAAAASVEMAHYRGNRSIYEPNAQAALHLQSIARLEAELQAARTSYDNVSRLARQSPQLAAIQTRIASLQGEISAERAKVASKQESLSSEAPTYERLALASAVADKQLASALSSLELARSEAQKKRLYLDVIVNPIRPDKAMLPRRVRAVVTVALIGTMVWGVLCLLIASVRDHLD